MKTLKITLFTAAIALSASLFVGCAGPAGTNGIDGTDGAQGPAGVNGSSSTFTSNPVDWTITSSGGYNFALAGYNVSIITTDAINTGVVAVYFQASSGNWSPLPDTYPTSTTSGVSQTLTYNYAAGVLNLQMQNSDNSVPSAPNAFNVTVVVIPTSVMKQHPGINTKDYTEVMQAIAANKATL